MKAEKEITRKDGIVYKRKQRDIIYNSDFCFKMKRGTLDIFKKIAKQEGIKHSTLAREILEKFVEDYESSNEENKKNIIETRTI